MSEIIATKEASYKGVAFLWRSAPTSGGRRVIPFLYPRSDKQAIEDQGLAPRKFSITGIISHDNYFVVRDNLLRALENKDAGVLVHPTYGEINGVKAGRYTITEKISELGRAEITMEFFIEDSSGIPRVAANRTSQVRAASDALNGSLSADLSEGYTVTSSFTGNFASAEEGAVDVAASMTDAIKKIEPLTDKLNTFRGQVTAYTNNITALIQEPSNLADSVGLLFSSMNDLYAAPGQTLDVIAGLFGFGADDPVFAQNTAGRIERKRNQDLLRANIKAQSLSYAYLNAVQVEYDSETALNAVNDDLEAQYLDARQNELLSNETLLNLDALRVEANAALSEILLNTRKVITIETRQIPLSVLVYQYYGSTDLVPTIAVLNNIQQNAFVSGQVQILTE
ncbi:MAG: DNA circularization N-terminal domain-containing protein [candidate division Zixibacteria bacterium]|nr:DNA circularization N-terminal domain-containing protein [candidate division Zixibacteria bacterium]